MKLIAQFAPDFPDDELVVYRNTAVAVEGYPHGFECLIRLSKKKIAEAEKAGKGPLWRHGDVIEVRPRGAGDGEVSPVT